MDDLRLILLLIGAAVIGAIYLRGTMRRRRDEESDSGLDVPPGHALDEFDGPRVRRRDPSVDPALGRVESLADPAPADPVPAPSPAEPPPDRLPDSLHGRSPDLSPADEPVPAHRSERASARAEAVIDVDDLDAIAGLPAGDDGPRRPPSGEASPAPAAVEVVPEAPSPEPEPKARPVPEPAREAVSARAPESVSAQPVSAQPVSAQPVSARPASPPVSRPVPDQPVFAEPASTEPVTTEPVTTEPVTTEPVPELSAEPVRAPGAPSPEPGAEPVPAAAAQRATERGVEPDIGSLDALEAAVESAPQQLDLDGLGERPARREPRIEGGGGDAELDLVIALTVMARRGRELQGPAIRGALDAVGLAPGDMQIYHRHAVGRAPGGPPVFSVANVRNPGSLDPEELDDLHTPGLAFFMRVPGPTEPASAFQQMLDAGRRVAERLDAVLCDETRSTLTPQSINHIRERIAEHARRRLIAARR